jgi:hypothetical protein
MNGWECAFGALVVILFTESFFGAVSSIIFALRVPKVNEPVNSESPDSKNSASEQD